MFLWLIGYVFTAQYLVQLHSLISLEYFLLKRAHCMNNYVIINYSDTISQFTTLIAVYANFVRVNASSYTFSESE